MDYPPADTVRFRLAGDVNLPGVKAPRKIGEGDSPRSTNHLESGARIEGKKL